MVDLLQNVILRGNVLASRPSPDTRFEIDLQTRGFVKVLPSFLKLKLKPPADGRSAVKFIIRDATAVDALYAIDDTFPTGECELLNVASDCLVLRILDEL